MPMAFGRACTSELGTAVELARDRRNAGHVIFAELVPPIFPAAPAAKRDDLVKRQGSSGLEQVHLMAKSYSVSKWAAQSAISPSPAASAAGLPAAYRDR